jgi:hypothetical protein
MSLVIVGRVAVLTIGVMAAGLAPAVAPVRAQWWHSGPKDFEDCADLAEQAKTRQDRTSALAECNAKFAGRRKPGGGYTYYDFMQDRSFDIAGPNPTHEEQKKIDQQYTVYLEQQRPESAAAMPPAKLQPPRLPEPPPEVQRISLRTETEKVPLPVASPFRFQATVREPHPRPKPSCAKGTFACDWPHLSQGLDNLKKLFNPSAAKAKRS